MAIKNAHWRICGVVNTLSYTSNHEMDEVTSEAVICVEGENSFKDRTKEDGKRWYGYFALEDIKQVNYGGWIMAMSAILSWKMYYVPPVSKKRTKGMGIKNWTKTDRALSDTQNRSRALLSYMCPLEPQNMRFHGVSKLDQDCSAVWPREFWTKGLPLSLPAQCWADITSWSKNSPRTGNGRFGQQPLMSEEFQLNVFGAIKGMRMRPCLRIICRQYKEEGFLSYVTDEFAKETLGYKEIDALPEEITTMDNDDWKPDDYGTMSSYFLLNYL